MQKVGKSFLIAFGGTLGLAAAVVLGINLYVQSAGMQARIARELSAALHVPVRMAGTTLTPWGGLKVSGVTVGQPDPAHAGGNFFEASNFAASFQWMPLLQHHLAIRHITVNDPKVAWFQTAGGKWQLPGKTESKPAALEPPIATQPEAPPEQQPTAPAPPPRAKARPMTVTLEGLRVRRGAFVFLDARGNRLAAFSDVTADCPAIGKTAAEGHATSVKAAVRDTIFFENVRTPFSYRDGELALPGLEASLAGGTLHGDARIRTAAKRSPFTVDAHFDGVNLDTLLASAGGVPGRATGTLAGWLSLYGESGRTGSLGGSGQVTLADGKMQHEFFQLLGQALQINELAMLTLKDARLDVRVGEGSVWIDRLVLQGANIQLEACGTARIPDGKLQLDARLTLNERLSRQLPGFVTAYLQPLPNSSQRYLDFPVTGTVSKPQTNVMERILGRKIEKEMGSIFQNIFKPKKKKAKNEPPAPSVGGSPGPNSTAAPSTSE